MNKELLLKVADAIENDSLKDVRFNMAFFQEYVMDEFKEDCYAACCIVGYTLRVSGISYISTRMAEAAADILGIDQVKADKLFYARALEAFSFSSMEDIPAKLATAVIRKLVKTGEVDWTGEYKRLYSSSLIELV